LIDFKTKIEAKALELGFLNIGFAPVHELTEEAKRLESWLNNGYNASMDYMANHFDKRINPAKLVDGAKTVISLSYNYYSEKSFDKGHLKISKYA